MTDKKSRCVVDRTVILKEGVSVMCLNSKKKEPSQDKERPSG